MRPSNFKQTGGKLPSSSPPHMSDHRDLRTLRFGDEANRFFATGLALKTRLGARILRNRACFMASLVLSRVASLVNSNFSVTNTTVTQYHKILSRFKFQYSRSCMWKLDLLSIINGVKSRYFRRLLKSQMSPTNACFNWCFSVIVLCQHRFNF